MEFIYQKGKEIDCWINDTKHIVKKTNKICLWKVKSSSCSTNNVTSDFISQFQFSRMMIPRQFWIYSWMKRDFNGQALVFYGIEAFEQMKQVGYESLISQVITRTISSKLLVTETRNLHHWNLQLYVYFVCPSSASTALLFVQQHHTKRSMQVQHQ